jgi:tetratricopeptide (TPR) repeat protein
MWWKLGGQLVAALALILVAVLDYRWWDKRTRKFRRTRLTLFVVLGLLLGVSVLDAYFDHREVSQQNNDLLKRLDTLGQQAQQAEAASAARDATSQQRIAEFRVMLDPFIVEARRRNPGVTDQQALSALARHLAVVEQRADRTSKQVAEQRRDMFHVAPIPGGLRVDSPQSAVARHYGVGLEAYKASRLEEARAEFELILAQEPQHIPGLNMLGIVLSELGFQSEALASLQKAYELSKDPDIKNNIEVVRRFPGRRIRFQEKAQ